MYERLCECGNKTKNTKYCFLCLHDKVTKTLDNQKRRQRMTARKKEIFK